MERISKLPPVLVAINPTPIEPPMNADARGKTEALLLICVYLRSSAAIN
jgi:hypothetical protein